MVRLRSICLSISIKIRCESRLSKLWSTLLADFGNGSLAEERFPRWACASVKFVDLEVSGGTKACSWSTRLPNCCIRARNLALCRKVQTILVLYDAPPRNLLSCECCESLALLLGLTSPCLYCWSDDDPSRLLAISWILTRMFWIAERVVVSLRFLWWLSLSRLLSKLAAWPYFLNSSLLALNWEMIVRESTLKSLYESICSIILR